MHVEIVLTPADIACLPGRDLSIATCVVFDVLRATSTMLTALANGARRILPAATIEAARELRSSRYPQALLGGERGGVRVAGFDLGNSPLEYSSDSVRGRDIIMTTTNGTVALQACAKAGVVYAGALLNLDAQAATIRRQTPPPELVLLICAGTGDDFALEDGLAAAALLARLTPHQPQSDASMLVHALHKSMGDHPIDVLRSSANGRRLAQLGLGADVKYCAQVSVLDAVAILRAGSLQCVSA